MPPEVANLIALFQRGAFAEVVIAAERLRRAKLRQHTPLIEVVAGAALAELEKWDAAEACYRRALALDPRFVDAHYNLALALHRQEKFTGAERSYRQVLAFAPGHLHAANNLGVVLRELKRHGEACAVLEQVLAAQPGFVDALVNLGVTRKHMAEPEAARTALQRAVSLSPDCADGWYNLGLVLADLRETDASVAAFRRACDLRPQHRESHANLGQALANQGKLNEAVAAFERGLTFAPDDPQSWTGLGLVWLDLGDTAKAIDAWDRALASDPRYYRALGFKRFNQLCQGDWSSTGPLPDPPEGKAPEGSVGSPMSFLVLDDNPSRQRRIAELSAAAGFPHVTPRPFPAVRDPAGGRLRIAYLSPDFNNHPVAQLMAGVLEKHDRTRFEVFAYAHSMVPPDAMTARIAASVDHFIDIATMTDTAVADMARRHRLDIAVDLAGHTRGSRTGLLAHRLAPVQIAHLGYPGTIGAPFIDYLVADARVIPPEQRAHYRENLILLPGSFQPNDDQRPFGQRAHGRADYGLPDKGADGSGVVFCCFNNTYKISRAEWDVWMRLLERVPGSVLWLSRPVPAAEANFQHEAAVRGIDPARLVFAEKVSYPDHLDRHRLADLFLDTFNYNAHTTASDALWGNLPVLTLAGRSLAARVAASLLHAVDLPELVTTSVADYEALALTLARDPQRLADLRAELAESRTTSSLFDTLRYTRNLETGFAMATERSAAGLPPADIVVPDCGASPNRQ